jgi:hypothetical protein
VQVQIPGKAAGRTIHSIQLGKKLESESAGDTLKFKTTVTEADFITIR